MLRFATMPALHHPLRLRSRAARRVLVWGAALIVVPSVVVIAGAWLVAFSPFRDVDARADEAFMTCAYGGSAQCEILRQTYEEGCAEGYGQHCLLLARMYLGDRRIARDPHRAMQLYDKLCQANVPQGCAGTGKLSATGRGTRKDLGPLDEEQRYYLTSRGLTPERADRLQVHGFFEEVVSQIPDPAVAAWARERINDKFITAQVEGRV